MSRSAGRKSGEDAAPLVELAGPEWLYDGAWGEPFDFTAHVRRLCDDIVTRCPAFFSIDMNRVLIGVIHARKRRHHGLQARITPMRFPGGALYRRRGSRWYGVQRYFVDGVEMLYLIDFCLPRFLDQTFDQKFITIFHELYHIAPEFNGDLRRHPGRCQFHTHSKRGYDQAMVGLVREYLQQAPDPGLHAFLRLSFRDLEKRHGAIWGVAVPLPRLVPVGEAEAGAMGERENDRLARINGEAPPGR